MNRIPADMLEEMCTHEVRIGRIFHVQGSLTCGDSIADDFEEFIEDYDAWGQRFEEWMPSRGAKLYENIDGDPWEICDILQHNCPYTFIVVIERTLPRCIRADETGEGLGSWRGGFGCYTVDVHFTDSIMGAVAASLELAQKHTREEWQRAIEEDRVSRRKGGFV